MSIACKQEGAPIGGRARCTRRTARNAVVDSMLLDLHLRRECAQQGAMFTTTSLLTNGGGATYTNAEASITECNKIEQGEREQSGTEALLTNGGGDTYTNAEASITECNMIEKGETEWNRGAVDKRWWGYVHECRSEHNRV
jgi:hypothetical protein